MVAGKFLVIAQSEKQIKFNDATQDDAILKVIDGQVIVSQVDGGRGNLPNQEGQPEEGAVVSRKNGEVLCSALSSWNASFAFTGGEQVMDGRALMAGRG